jgi:hypothetical protein
VELKSLNIAEGEALFHVICESKSLRINNCIIKLNLKDRCKDTVHIFLYMTDLDNIALEMKSF